MLESVLRPRRPGAGLALAFLVGLPIGGLLTAWSFGRAALQPVAVTGRLPPPIAAGLLVGIGTRLANGCTSGHGVCGIPRLVDALDRRHRHLHGRRGSVTVFITRHVV